MISYPHIDPIAFSFGQLKVHWYGIMYLFAFLSAWGLANLRIAKSFSPVSAQQFSDLMFYCMLGVIIGGRLGHMLFYAPGMLLSHPLETLKIWHGGMSFHGGLIGVACSIGYFSWRNKVPLLPLMDFMTPLVPLGLGFGRIGNFINGELVGRVTQLPWGMHFPSYGAPLRHPSQLYEFLFEGVLLFVIMWRYSSHKRPFGRVSALFLICYGIIRFLIEFVRAPDPSIGFIAFAWMTMGQVLSLPMIGIGIWIWTGFHNRKIEV